MASSTMIRLTARRCLTHGKRSQNLLVASRSLSVAPSKDGSALGESMHPNYSLDSIKPPQYWGKPPAVEEDPMAYKRKPVSSAHSVDISSDPPKLSVQDSAVLSPSGSVVHGRYGELSLKPEAGIPLEYLSLLHPAAEGVAALRATAGSATNGTLLMYGVSEPSGMSALQLASSSGLSVVGVVAGHHSGQHDFVDTLKSFTNEPGTVVPEEFAIVKAAFREIVDGCVNGDSADAMAGYDANAFLDDFRSSVLNYVDYFPESKLSPNEEDYTFSGKEKDRENWDANISAYLTQFQKGAPQIDPVVLKEAFTKEQYATFKAKFGQQTTACITGDDDAATEFVPAAIVAQMMQSPEAVSEYIKNQKPVSADVSTEDFVPYEFSILKNQIQNGVEVDVGGPILGAVVAVTPELTVAAEAVAKGKTLREKAEALQFLTDSQKNAFAAASSVMAAAKEAGKPVVVVGGKLPGVNTVEPTGEDVNEALAAMELEEDGTSRLNFFLQIYRASDYPVYADYAIHRATEAVAGPRQIIVTK